MRYRFLLVIFPLSALVISCQPVNRDKNNQAVAVERMQPSPGTPLQPETR